MTEYTISVKYVDENNNFRSYDTKLYADTDKEAVTFTQSAARKLRERFNVITASANSIICNRICNLQVDI